MSKLETAKYNVETISVPLPRIVRKESARRCHSSQLAGGVFLFILLVMFSVQAQADFTFDDFSDITGLKLNSAAVQSGNVLLLTPALTDKQGSAWFTTKQFVRDGFETTFQFQITVLGVPTDCKGKNGGDGFAFLIQNSSAGVSALGGSGRDLGYGGISNSLAIEFDTFCNSEFNDPNENHISVQTRGQAANSADHTFSLGAATNRVVP